MKAILAAQLLLVFAPMVCQDQDLRKFDLDYIVSATRDTQPWRDVTGQAYQYIQKINALEGKPSSDDIIGQVINFSKNIWDSLVPKEVDFSGRIDFSISGQEIIDANMLPLNVLIIRFSMKELSAEQPELWDSMQNILDDACKTLEEQRSKENNENPLDFIQSHIAQIRDIIHNNPTLLDESLSIWLKVEQQQTV